MLCVSVMALGIGGTDKNGAFACKQMPHLVKMAKKNDLAPALLVSLIHHESRWTPTAISRSHACGLTQVIPKYTGGRASGNKKYTCEDLQNPHTSITAGSKILSFWIRSYGRGNVKIGLCAYNAGYRCKGENPNASGMNYARAVLRTQKRIQKHLRKLKRRESKNEVRGSDE